MIDLRLGNIIDVLPTLEADTFDGCLCDPPYELGFMGKHWDASGITYNVELWRQVYHALKPGAYLLAFGGTRTSHRLACAIEDAGFEIRDTIDWVYGSGFPKSLDVSKAIDKTTIVACDVCHGTGKTVNPNAKDWEDYWLDEPCKTCDGTGQVKGVEREVVGKQKITGQALGQTKGLGLVNPDQEFRRERDITIPATDSARTWQGYGTALKPAHEPIIVARKPLSEATVAANCQKWGTGAINVDAGRIEAEPELAKNWQRNQSQSAKEGRNSMNGGLDTIDLRGYTPSGRFPANLITDGSAEVVAMFPQSDTRPAKDWQNSGDGHKHNDLFSSISKVRAAYPNDTGSAARFFKSCPIDEDDYPPLYYCAKASKAERDAGCEGMEVHRGSDDYRPNDDGENGIQSRLHGATIKGHNGHPTVKPISLTRYLATLILPPAEYAPRKMLVPFAGVASEMIGAMLAGWDEVIGIEREAEYCEIGRARLEYWQAQLQLALPMVTA